MKKMLADLLVGVMIMVSAIGCGGKGDGADSSGSGDLLSSIMEEGKIVAAIEVGNEPWSYTDPNTNEYTGFSIDMITGFAEAIGVEVEFTPLEFSELIPAVQSGRADIISSNISRTAARAATVLFTEPVGYSNCVVLVREDSGISSISDLDNADYTITAPAGSIQEELAKENFPNADVSTLTSTTDAIAALKAGRADAYVTDSIQAYPLMESDATLVMLPENLNSDTVAFALNLSTSSYTLRDAFNTYLKVIKLDGTYNELYNKYFDTDWVPLTTEYGA